MSSHTYTKILRMVVDIQKELNFAGDALEYSEVHELAAEFNNLNGRMRDMILKDIKDRWDTVGQGERPKIEAWKDYD